MHLADLPALRITEEADGATTVLRLAGELDLATADVLRERLRAMPPGVRRLSVDLGGLEFLDVTGVGVLIEARKRIVDAGGAISLRRPRPMVRRVLSLLQLEDVLHIED